MMRNHANVTRASGINVGCKRQDGGAWRLIVDREWDENENEADA